MKQAIITSLCILLISCNSSDSGTETETDYTQNEIDFLQERAEFIPNGIFEKEILFQMVTNDPEEIEIFEDTLIPWISIENAILELPNLVGKEELVLGVQNAILVIDYPMEKPIEIEIISKNPNGFTREDLLIQISENYLRIYKEEEESSTIPVTPMEDRVMINRNTTNGKYGIWGHDLIDIDLSGIDVYIDGNKTYLYLYVES